MTAGRGRGLPLTLEESRSQRCPSQPTRWDAAPDRPTRARVDRRPGHPARPRRRLPRDRQGDGGRAVPDVLLVDHPRVRGPRRRPVRRPGPRAVRVRLDADAHRLAAVVHPRLPRPPRRRHRGGRRDRPQPSLPRRLAQPRRRGRGADLPRRRAARIRRRHRARARRRRLLPRHQRRRLRRLRGGQALQRPALVPPRRAQRRCRPDDLRQRPHRDDEPRRHERDDGRLRARPRPVPAARRRATAPDVGDERRLRVDGLLRADAARSRSRRSRTASTSPRPPGSTTTPATAAGGCGSRRR